MSTGMLYTGMLTQKHKLLCHMDCKQKKWTESMNGADQLKMCNKGKLFHILSDVGLLSTQPDDSVTGYLENVYLLHHNSVLRRLLRLYG